MGKNLFVLAVFVAMLTGCSKTETVEQAQGGAIGFTKAYIGNAVDSRAISVIDQSNISEFIVYGGYNDMEHVFNGVTVSGTAGADDWTYDVTRYWVPGKDYKFAAYAPSSVTGNGTVETDFANGALNFKGYTSDPTHQNDLIYATATQKTNDPLVISPDKIQFRFGHLLSMVKFTFNSGFGNDIKVTVSNLNVSGMIADGDYTGSTQAWTPGSNTVSEGAAFTELASTEAINRTSGNQSASSYDFAVIPQTIVNSDAGVGTKVTVSFDVTVQDNLDNYIVGSEMAGVTITATLPGYTWTAGNRYNYNVTIAGENVSLFPIEFGAPDVTPITTDPDFSGNEEIILPEA